MSWYDIVEIRLHRVSRVVSRDKLIACRECCSEFLAPPICTWGNWAKDFLLRVWFWAFEPRHKCKKQLQDVVIRHRRNTTPRISIVSRDKLINSHACRECCSAFLALPICTWGNWEKFLLVGLILGVRAYDTSVKISCAGWGCREYDIVVLRYRRITTH